jgi:hypothetical protein
VRVLEAANGPKHQSIHEKRGHVIGPFHANSHAHSGSGRNAPIEQNIIKKNVAVNHVVANLFIDPIAYVPHPYKISTIDATTCGIKILFGLPAMLSYLTDLSFSIVAVNMVPALSRYLSAVFFLQLISHVFIRINSIW